MKIAHFPDTNQHCPLHHLRDYRTLQDTCFHTDNTRVRLVTKAHNGVWILHARYCFFMYSNQKCIGKSCSSIQLVNECRVFEGPIESLRIFDSIDFINFFFNTVFILWYELIEESFDVLRIIDLFEWLMCVRIGW